MVILKSIQKMKNTLLIVVLLIASACKQEAQFTSDSVSLETSSTIKYPSDVLPFMDQWKILLGDGTSQDSLVNYKKDGFFYTQLENNNTWIVYKTPNTGTTSPNSSNTRTELGQKKRWTPEEGGKLTGKLQVKHVSTTGDARVAASYSVVVGQIHSDEGHKNEPLKIFYKKFPGHSKGSVFWNYEINTEGDNSGRWDFSTPIWGYDMSVVGVAPNMYPPEPEDGIELGELFSYEINVYKGIMYLTFKSEGHDTKVFTKSLISSEFSNDFDMPKQVVELYKTIGRDGVERIDAYAGERQFFKQGAYNQTNGKNPEKNMVWSTGSEIYGGDIQKQYANGSYAEVWFKEGTLSLGSPVD